MLQRPELIHYLKVNLVPPLGVPVLRHCITCSGVCSTPACRAWRNTLASLNGTPSCFQGIGILLTGFFFNQSSEMKRIATDLTSQSTKHSWLIVLCNTVITEINNCKSLATLRKHECSAFFSLPTTNTLSGYHWVLKCIFARVLHCRSLVVLQYSILECGEKQLIL